MVVVAVLFVAQAQRLVPAQAPFFPLLEPLEFLAGAYKELHFHLFELAHAEYELTGHDFVAESLAYLSDAERYAHAACLLHVEVVHKYALCGFRTQIHGHGAVGCGAHLGFEHKVELANLGPVACAREGAYDFFVKYNLAQAVEVVVVHCGGEALVEGVAFGYVFKYPWVGLAVESFVE